jgi:electron transport complex protein RnfB
MFGNGSLYLQVNHDRCVNCNICAISTACPAQALVQVPATNPYLLRGKGAAAK